jgi:hypothetical protein
VAAAGIVVSMCSIDSDKMDKSYSCSLNCSLHFDTWSWQDMRIHETFDRLKAAKIVDTEKNHTAGKRMKHCCAEEAECLNFPLDRRLLVIQEKEKEML